MIGARSDWWNQDTPKDKVLLLAIREAERLGRLPDPDKVPDPMSCRTYFGSCEKVCKHVAKILYGNEKLTSPEDLLPQERELPGKEQARILADRKRIYEKKIEELKTPGTLGRWRREAQQYQGPELPEGCVVTKLPTFTVKELRERQNRNLKSTKGLIPQKPAQAPRKVQQRRIPTMQEQWAASPYNPANRCTAAAGMTSSQALHKTSNQQDLSTESVKQSSSQPRASASGRPRGSSLVYPQCGSSDQSQQSQLKQQEPKISVAGEADQLSQLGQKLDINSVDNDSVPRQENQATSEFTEKGVKKMGGPRRTREQVLGMLREMEQHYGKIPSAAQIREYTKAHSDTGIASIAVFSKLLGEKETWSQQLSEFVQNQSQKQSEEHIKTKRREGVAIDATSAANLATSAIDFTATSGPTSVAEPAANADAIMSASVAPNDAAPPDGPAVDSASDAIFGGVMTGDALDDGNKMEASASDSEEGAVASVNESGDESVRATGTPKPCQEAASQNGATARVEKYVININVTSLTLKFQLNGQDYELEVGFGSN